MLSDSLQGGCLGVVCIGQNRKDCLKIVNTAFTFIQTQTSSKHDGIKSLEREDALSFKDLNSTLKMLYKK